MLPEGKIGLLFAAIGRALRVLDDARFSAVALMVMITTMPAPPLLKAAKNMRMAGEPAASRGRLRCIG